METKIVNETVFRTERIPNGTKPKTVYVAKDGKEFTNENECKSYEGRLTAIEDGQDQFTEIQIGDADIQDNISCLVFGGYKVSSAMFFKWIATKDKTKLEKADGYLRAKGCHNFYDTLLRNEEFKDGDVIMISYWAENESSDYPSFKTEAMKFDDAIKIIDDLSSKMKEVFKK